VSYYVNDVVLQTIPWKYVGPELSAPVGTAAAAGGISSGLAQLGRVPYGVHGLTNVPPPDAMHGHPPHCCRCPPASGGRPSNVLGNRFSRPPLRPSSRLSPGTFGTPRLLTGLTTNYCCSVPLPSPHRRPTACVFPSQPTTGAILLR
jgi:hypothetical protein